MARNSGQRRRAIKGWVPDSQRGARRCQVQLTEEQFHLLMDAAARRNTSLPNFLRKAALALAAHDNFPPPPR